MNKQQIIDATIIGIVYHPEIRGISENAKADVAKMVRGLAEKLDGLNKKPAN